MRFSLGTGFLYVNKQVCKRICPVWLQGRKDCFSCYSLSLPMNNLFCRSWFFSCLHLWNATCSCPFSGCLMTFYFPMFFLLCTRQINSCPSSLLPPRLPVSPVALVVFPYQYFCRLGPVFKCAVLNFIVQLAAV